ncbi:hypothetical protein [Reichenbachiella agariperforans]|nr:hypothetical protein [Reichenbachiella agariperforans]
MIHRSRSYLLQFFRWQAMLLAVGCLTLCVFIIGSHSAVAQETNQHCQMIDVRTFSLPDSLIVDPSSIVLTPDQPYQLDLAQSQLTFEFAYVGEVCFRFFPIQKGKVHQHKSTDLYDSTVSFSARQLQGNAGYQKEELFATPNIYKTGSLTRGVSFGNSQSVNVLSNFNFQMDGQLTDDLNIRADVTDQNVPFQPEGNTQQVREFDNVTFEVYNDSLSLLAGDVVLKNGDSYFLRHYKNALGGQADIRYGLGNNGQGRSVLAIAAAKGQFADVTVQAVEGLQGPYQLSGPSGQQYVVVLANSEQVYLDGQLLKRGFNYDYIIDYNLGEITFNPSVLITQFSRIRVTYEYSDQNYSRSIIAAHQELQIGRTTVHAGYYREKDNRNKPLAFNLTNDDKIQMSQAGDHAIPVPISGATETDYSGERVQYMRLDTVDLDGMPQTIYRYSRDSTIQLYSVSFTNVGIGSGDYALVDNDVNGRVYEWVSPSGGVSQGEYAPVRFVPAPNQREMFVLGTDLKLSPYLTWSTELALSNEDKNLYAEVDDDDNSDVAIRSGLEVKDKPLGRSDYKWSGELNYEYDGGDFQPIDRFRSIEYDRNWSYTPATDSSRTANHIFNLGVKMEKDRFNLIRANYSNRQKDQFIDGYQIDSELRQSLGGMKVLGGFYDMKNKSLVEESTWRRMFGEGYFDSFFVVPGYRYEVDDNQVSAVGSDSLVRTAMNYESHQFYLRSHDTLRTKFRLDYTLREDKSIWQGILKPFTLAKTARAQLSTAFSQGQEVGMNFTYRELAYQEEFSDLEDEALILGNLTYRGVFFDKHVRTNLSYTTASSREILREFVYVEVATGEGTHTWRDLNGDGVQDLTEFFEAVNFDERRYIKVFVPTSEYVEAFNTIFTFTMNASMPRGWKSAGGFKGVLSQFSNNTSININKKSTEDSFASRFNPFTLDVKDQNLVFVRDGIRSTLFFNRSGQGLGLDVTYASVNSKQLISRGVESRYAVDWLYNMRYHLSREWIMTLGLVDQLKENASQFQAERNYLIQSYKLEPGLVWQPKNNYRMSVTYSYTQKTNLEGDKDEKSLINIVSSEMRWSNGAKNALTANISYSLIDYDGDENTAAAYELLNALRPGHNYTWRINYSQKLISGLQMSLGYEGRQSADSPMIHMGRMQVTALF